MPAELISLHTQNGTKLSLPTMPTQGSSSSSRRDGGGKDEEKRKQSNTNTTTTPETDSLTSKLQNEVQQHVTQEQMKFIKRYRTEIAASASSVVSTLSTFPLDSVKTRMQTYKYNGFVDCVRHTYGAEKMKGFFRGKLAFCLLTFFQGLHLERLSGYNIELPKR